MKKAIPITTLFVDIGGVLLTDGWGHEYRKMAAEKFDLNPEDMEKRHYQAFDTYVLGKLTIDEYLSWVVFYEQRPFIPAQFRSILHTDYRTRCAKLAARGLEIEE